jgi:uncharacterized repeat protein (TIGR03803 family)
LGNVFTEWTKGVVMVGILGVSGTFSSVCGLALAICAAFGSADAKGFHVLHAFTPGRADGYSPDTNLIRDKAGNFYGTTTFGGAAGDGTVFVLAADGTERVIYSFTGGSDGLAPVAGAIRDKSGNLYGTTYQGGNGNCPYVGCGTVFKVAPDGTESVLHVFSGGSDGSQPIAGLIKDKVGNLYGTTLNGGQNGGGVVFALAPDGTETVLHAFAGGNDGAGPGAGLIRDSAGYFYGTTAAGGASNSGTVFKVAPDGTETVLYSFRGGKDGDNPLSGLVEDAVGNFYGTTGGGGRRNLGTVFRLAPDGTETVLHAFRGGRDGAAPLAGLTPDGSGNFYGTTDEGGGACVNDVGCGVVFKIATDGTESVLHRFTGRSDGASPDASLLSDKNGNLFGTAELGGANGGGTVFALKE